MQQIESVMFVDCAVGNMIGFLKGRHRAYTVSVMDG